MWFISTEGTAGPGNTRHAGFALCIVILVASLAFLARGTRGFTATAASGPSQAPRKTGETTRGDTKSNIRVHSTLVLIPVTVVDPLYRFVNGLKREDFRLFEDQTEQTILHFSVEDAPASIGLVVDCSGSMEDKLAQSHRAVIEFLRIANPEDEFFLLLFGDRSELVADFTNSAEAIESRLSAARAEGSTALLDALYLALHRIRLGNAARKALLLISDGGENSSRYTEREVKSMAQETDAQVFAIGIYKRVPADTESRDAFNGRTLMARIAEITGGFQYPVQKTHELPETAAKIGAALRNQYLLAYSPTNRDHDGKYRRVSVKVLQPIGRPPLRAYWRAGYYAPDSVH